MCSDSQGVLSTPLSRSLSPIPSLLYLQLMHFFQFFNYAIVFLLKNHGLNLKISCLCASRVFSLLFLLKSICVISSLRGQCHLSFFCPHFLQREVLSLVVLYYLPSANSSPPLTKAQMSSIKHKLLNLMSPAHHCLKTDSVIQTLVGTVYTVSTSASLFLLNIYLGVIFIYIYMCVSY